MPQMKMIGSMLCLALFIGCASVDADPSTDSPPQGKRAKIIELLKLMRTADLVVEDVMKNIELSTLPREDKKIYQEIANPQQLRERIADAYMKVLTEKEVDAWLAFYNGPGKSIGEKQNALFEVSKPILREWGNSLSVRVQQEKAKRAAAKSEK